MLTTKPKIFVSHCSKAQTLAKRVNARLQKAGYETFFAPTDIRIEDWSARLVNELQRNVIVLAIVTPDYFKRKWTRLEFATAFGRDPDGRSGLLCIVNVDATPMKYAYQVVQHVRISSRTVEADFKLILKGLEECVQKRRRRKSGPSAASMSGNKRGKGNRARPRLPSPAALATTYRTRLKQEMRDICSRIAEPEANPGSRTKRIVFGWQAVLNLEAPTAKYRPIPSILLHAMKRKYRELDEHAKIAPSKLARHDIVTLRYYLFCLIAIQDSKLIAVDSVVDSYIDEIQTSAPARDRHEFIDHYDSLGALLASIEQPRCQITSDMAKVFAAELGHLARNLGLSLHDLWDEENAETRTAGRFRAPSATDVANTPNYRIEIYFADEKESYFKLLRGLLANSLTFVRTVSETMIPSEIARATLWVHYPGNNLAAIVQNLIEQKEFHSIVLDHRVFNI